MSLLRKDFDDKISIKQLSELLLSKNSCLESEFSKWFTVFMFLYASIKMASVRMLLSKLKIYQKLQEKFDRPSHAEWSSYSGHRKQKADKIDIQEHIGDFTKAKARKRSLKTEPTWRVYWTIDRCSNLPKYSCGKRQEYWKWRAPSCVLLPKLYIRRTSRK